VAIEHYESRACDKSKIANKLRWNSAQIIDSKDLCRRGGRGWVGITRLSLFRSETENTAVRDWLL